MKRFLNTSSSSLLSRRLMSTDGTNMVRLIDSSMYFGMHHLRAPLPAHIRSSYIEKMFRAGVQNIQAGNMNCNVFTPQTKEILTELKDVKYGERILSAGVLTPSMGTEFLTTGADEMIIPINLSLPYPLETLSFFDTLISILRSEGYQVRLQLDGAFTYCPDALSHIVERSSQRGISHLTIIDSDNQAKPASVGLLCDRLKSSFYSDRISFAFNNQSLSALSNIYTALQENIRSFHVSTNGLGGLPDIEQMIRFINYNGYQHDVTHPERLDEISWWIRHEIDQYNL